MHRSELPCFSIFRIQREQIQAKKQEIEVMRAKNCGKTKPVIRDVLRPESATKSKLKRPTMRKPMNRVEVKHDPFVYKQLDSMFLTNLSNSKLERNED